MNIPDHISESLETLIWVKIIEFFNTDPDPGSIIFLTLDPGRKKFRDKHPGSATLARNQENGNKTYLRHPAVDAWRRLLLGVLLPVPGAAPGSGGPARHGVAVLPGVGGQVRAVRAVLQLLLH
jgi:hypothetical protein